MRRVARRSGCWWTSGQAISLERRRGAVWGRQAIVRHTGITDARRGDWLCLERDEPRGCQIGEVLRRVSIGYRTVLPLFRKGEIMDHLKNSVFMESCLCILDAQLFSIWNHLQIFYPIPPTSPFLDMQDFVKCYHSMHLAMHTIMFWYSIPRDQQLGSQYRYRPSLQDRQATEWYG